MGANHESRNEPIVVAVDGSESASAAVVWAARAAQASSRPLRIVTVVHIPGFYYSEPYLAESFRDELEESGRANLADAKKLAQQTAGPGVNVTTEGHRGRVANTLVELSKTARMVVLGSRGHGEFTGLVVGSTAVAVLSHAESPVVVVRGRTVDGAPPNDGPIVVGVDGSEQSEAATAVAFEEASVRDVELVAVHVWSDVSVQPSLGAVPEDPHWNRIQAEEELVLSERLAGYRERYPDLSVRRMVERDRPVRVLSGFAEEAQLIVVGHRGRGGLAGMLLGSTSNALVHTADCPVMVVRA
ncbi:MAG: universal stress protein [Rhodococcus sp.]|nr:universal stress protein [Rhodococcus sp. (in: high G+C Gram-positive bacteria)]